MRGAYNYRVHDWERLMEDLISRVKGLILSPRKEWDKIEMERTSIPDLYTRYIVILAAIPPFATFFGSWLFGAHGLHPTFLGGLWRAVVQYALSLPALFGVAFVVSMAAPHFDGRSDDRRALALAAEEFSQAGFALRAIGHQQQGALALSERSGARAQFLATFVGLDQHVSLQRRSAHCAVRLCQRCETPGISD